MLLKNDLLWFLSEGHITVTFVQIPKLTLFFFFYFRLSSQISLLIYEHFTQKFEAV